MDPRHEVVGEAGDGAEVVELARTLEPDVVLMDVRMPGTDGIEATRRLDASGSTARVLMLTTFDADEFVYDSMRELARRNAAAYTRLITPPGKSLRVSGAHRVLRAWAIVRRGGPLIILPSTAFPLPSS